MSVNSIDFMPFRSYVKEKAFYRQTILGFSSARKETIDKDILVTSRNGDRKIMESIKMMSSPTSRIRNWN